MTTNLIELGNQIRDGYASSVAEGHAAWMHYISPDGMRHIHVPEMTHKADGQLDFPPSDDSEVEAKAHALDMIKTRVVVENVRQAGNDMLILETLYTGTLPDGNDFRYPDTQLFTFRDGKIVQLIQVASAEMWATLLGALKTVSAPGYDAGTLSRRGYVTESTSG